MIELLRTKLFIPRPRKNLVSRPRLVDRLNTGLTRKLTLIAAPAGFGKTTLLTFLIDHLPKNMHLVMTTRVDPPLPLSRLRVHNQPRLKIITVPLSMRVSRCVCCYSTTDQRSKSGSATALRVNLST